MAKSKNKYYVVWKGAKPGIYTTWSECQAQITGFKGALYKGFPSYETATKAFNEKANNHIASHAPKATNPVSSSAKPITNSISVDAACSGNPGVMEYQGVVTSNSKQLFHKQFEVGTNNIGEFLAIVHGLAFLKQKNIDLPIYTDSKTAMKWVKDKRCNTKLDLTNNELQDLILRAENWLKANTYTTKILKWDTKNWGEIPADFGRK